MPETVARYPAAYVPPADFCLPQMRINESTTLLPAEWLDHTALAGLRQATEEKNQNNLDTTWLRIESALARPYDSQTVWRRQVQRDISDFLDSRNPNAPRVA
jgi:hypothetical protein